MHTLINVIELAAQGNDRLSTLALQTQELYLSTEYRLIWVNHGRPTIQATEAFTILNNAADKGLDPRDYNGNSDAFSFLSTQLPIDSSESALIRFDLALSLATMRFVSDIHAGRANPRPRPFVVTIGEKTVDLASFVLELAAAPSVEPLVESIEPHYNGYTRTLAALQRYRTFSQRDQGAPLPDVAKSIRPGMTYSGLARLRALLLLLGDLSDLPEPTSTTYDEELSAAVRQFQERHGLEGTGFLDTPTIHELNVPLPERILQLELTLERWRWLPDTFRRPPIVVNIPEFRLHVIDAQHRIVNSMNIVVGRAYHHPTPVFEGAIKSVLFRPPWNVPLEIQRQELLPEIEKNPAYLSENSFDIVDASGNPVETFPPTAETLNKLRSGHLFLRQRPGDENSLGLVKFEFPNPYDIYMHGTPAQELFSRTRRDFSHGCVRVEDPVALAVWLLRDTPGWDRERIESAMHANHSERVSLETPTPVWIVYGTAVVLEDGRVRFFKDLYGEDADLQQELAKIRSLDSAPTTSLP